MIKNFVVSILVLSAAVPCFAGQGAFQTEAFTSLQQAAEGDANAMGRLSDNSARGASMSQGPVSARTLAYRPELDAPRVVTVNHMHDVVWDGTTYRMPRSHNSWGRGFDAVEHPATELLESNNSLEKIAGGILFGLLAIPAAIVGVVNAFLSNTPLTKGLAIHNPD